MDPLLPIIDLVIMSNTVIIGNNEHIIICNNDVITDVIMSNNSVIMKVIMGNNEAIITVIICNNEVITM